MLDMQTWIIIKKLEQKQKETEMKLDKKGSNSHFEYKLHSVIERHYVLIRISKQQMHHLLFQVDLSEKMKWFKGTHDILGQNQKVLLQQ